MLHVALFQPKIPPNTGAIARLCVGMNARLHLIGPYTFSLSDHAVRRAGLDYWPHLKLTKHAGPEDFLVWLGDRQPWVVTKHGSMRYDEPGYGDEDVLLFGNELKGLPKQWRQRWPNRMVFIPILGKVRSYNLANAAAIVVARATMACLDRRSDQARE